MVKSVHLENEFMISRCSAYHSGFNFGYNIAEAVNFALKDWLEVATKASYCRCLNDSVTICMSTFITNLGLSPTDYGLAPVVKSPQIELGLIEESQQGPESLTTEEDDNTTEKNG